MFLSNAATILAFAARTVNAIPPVQRDSGSIDTLLGRPVDLLFGRGELQNPPYWEDPPEDEPPRPPPEPDFGYNGRYTSDNISPTSCGEQPGEGDRTLPWYYDCIAAAQKWNQPDDSDAGSDDGAVHTADASLIVESYDTCVTVWRPSQDLLDKPDEETDGAIIEEIFTNLADSCQAGETEYEFVSRYAFVKFEEAGVFSIYAATDGGDG